MEKLGARSKAREFAFKFLYQFQLPDMKDSLGDLQDLQEKLNEFKSSYSESDDEHPDNILDYESLRFSEKLIKATIENWTQLEEQILKQTKGWKLENLDKVDFSILIICTCEMKHFSETPRPVVINEGVNLAKKFGSENSYSFINGVLDSLSKE